MRVNKTYSLAIEAVEKLETTSRAAGKAYSRLLEELILDGCQDRESEIGIEASDEQGGYGCDVEGE